MCVPVYLQVLHTVLGSFKPSFDSVAWPRMALNQRRNWTPAEDSLLWLGMIRCGVSVCLCVRDALRCVFFSLAALCASVCRTRCVVSLRNCLDSAHFAPAAVPESQQCESGCMQLARSKLCGARSTQMWPQALPHLVCSVC